MFSQDTSLIVQYVLSKKPTYELNIHTSSSISQLTPALLFVNIVPGLMTPASIIANILTQKQKEQKLTFVALKKGQGGLSLNIISVFKAVKQDAYLTRYRPETNCDLRDLEKRDKVTHSSAGVRLYGNKAGCHA